MAGLLDDPMGYIGGLLGQAYNRARGVDPQTGEADYWKRGGLAGLLGMPSWDQQSPMDIAMGFAGATTPAVKGLGMVAAPSKGIRAYHGSPHDFDKFDLSKIGTGEGAQAYGHGLYFAENEGVARSYKAAGQPHYLGNDRAQAALDLLKETGGDKAAALALADQRMKATTKYSEGKLWMDVVNNFDDLVGRGPGKMYEVQINADPERFLDWDKPLSKQGPDVQAALGKFGFKAEPEKLRQFDDALLAALGDAGPPTLPKQPWDPLGANIYESSKVVPGMYRDKVGAASALREAGIPGIKYLDQGSRGNGSIFQKFSTKAEAQDFARKAGGTTVVQPRGDQFVVVGEPTKTSNFVVFDDSLISILRKYGLLGPMAGGAVAGATGDY